MSAGYAIIVVNIICTTYYSVILTYPIIFIWKSFSTTLPWANCKNSWNTENCLQLTDYHNLTNSFNSTTLVNSKFKTPADEFFHNEILQISDGIESLGDIIWSLLFGDIIVWIVMYLCIMNGIKSVGKVVYFTATFPFIILSVLFIRGITLPGAMEGIKFYLTPKWEELTNLKVWADAAIQIFFSLGPGWGGIVNMASYNNFRNNTKWDAMLIPIINCGTSIFAGFVVFSVLGFMSERTGIPVSAVATGGPGLAFVTYPEAIAMLPFSNVWAVLFFFMLFLLGLDSCFVQLEAIISAVIDEYPIYRKYNKMVTILAISIMFLGSIVCVTKGGMYIIQLLDWYSASISVILICLVEIIAVSWSYGVNNFIADIEFMIGYRPGKWWYFCWKFITPFILLVIFITTIMFNREITYNNIAYPKWAVAIGWMSCIISIICVPVYFVFYIYKTKRGVIEGIKIGFTATNWQPADAVHQREYENFVKNKVIKLTKIKNTNF